MKTSESIVKLAAALLQAQRAITFASKDAKNPHFKNTYADLPSVIDAVKPHLNAAGITYIQTPSPSEAGALALTTRLLHESGEWLEDTATIPLPKNDPQGYGSALTYARRYALSAITGLYQDDDDGNAACIAPNKPTLTRDQVAQIEQTADEANITIADICKTAHVKSLAEIEAARFDKLINWIVSQRKAA
ncbi:MAG TPA: ERF family protein [Noviherbaspirillum sp.]|nr:ERF family protein [Noviherbaspirillum sp.]